MTELARPLPALHSLSGAGQSEHEVLDTDPNDHEAVRLPQVDTLSAEDGVPDGNLDDRLLHRDLKARIFGAEGRVTIGRYEVLRRIGRGGMGTVYVAHDPELDRKVALKVLRADRTRGRERMLQEARALAKLAHPNVVTVHEVGLHDDRVFVAMELVEGKTLRTWLEARPSRTELYGVFVQAARGLAAAHRAGLVHRDFKPENVLIGDDGRVRVVDFGVAKQTDSLDSLDPAGSVGAGRGAGLALVPGASAAGQPELTLTGQLLGTPAYMAPEQFMGASVDARTDVFAFCVALHEALAGQRPFEGEDTASVSYAVLQGQPRPLSASDVPPALAALLRQGLRREADERPASLDGIIETLERAMAPARPRSLRRRVRIVGAFVSAAAIGGGLLVMGAEPEGPSPTEPAAAVVVPAEDDEAEATAFAAIAEATDDDARLAAAEAFLEQFGESASEVRRAIAHSAAGDVQWRRSCPSFVTQVHGLCVEEQPVGSSTERCSTPSRGSMVQHQREAVLTEPAQRHLRAAVALGGVHVPQDHALRQPFAEAISRARVQLADAELEPFLALDVPAEIDFQDATALSKSAFVLFYKELSGGGSRLMRAYAEVKQPGDPRWTLVAAARTGMISETASASLARTPVPSRMAADERNEYCKALEGYVAEPATRAQAAYAYCVEKAEAHGLGAEPIVGFCRARLQSYPAASEEE